MAFPKWHIFVINYLAFVSNIYIIAYILLLITEVAHGFSFKLSDPYPIEAVPTFSKHPLQEVFEKVGLEPQDSEHYFTYFVILPLLAVTIGFMAVPVGLVMGSLYSLKLLLPTVEVEE